MNNDASWMPELSGRSGSWAERIADGIAADVASGRLAPGDQLPTQRGLARQLGVTVGTVNRGYALAERAGLVRAEVGRGTFVAAPTDSGIHDASLARTETGAIELGLNYVDSAEVDLLLADALPRLAARESLAGLLALSPYGGRQRHRATVARWLRRFGVSVDGNEELLLCTGVQHGLAATLAALTSPGDTVLTESLTSPGIKALAAMHHLRLVPVTCDAHGLVPEALSNACRSTRARVLFTMPTLQTPTTTTMPEERRQAIAKVIRAEQLIAIEDDVWGFLAGGSVTPLHALAPESVVYIGSVSKSFAPGFRVGYVVAPAALQRAISTCIGTMTWTAPLMAELLCRWIEDGTAARIAEERARTAAERQRWAADLLGPACVPSVIPAYHLWVPLPEPWRAEAFVEHAAALGVSLAPTDTFVPGRAPTPHAIRVCTGMEASAERLTQGLRIIARMLDSGPAAFSVSGV